jgi:hypothetical protein
MADKQIIAAKVSVDTGNSNQNLKEVNESSKATAASLDKLSATAKNTGKDIDVSSNKFNNLKNTISSVPGPVGQSVAGINTLQSAFKALLANPIGLIITGIVLAFTALYKIFTNTFEGAQKVEQAFAGIKAAAQAVFDNITKLASAIAKFFTFDFSGAIKDIKEVVSAAEEAYDAMSNLVAEQQKLKAEQLQNDLEQAERARQLAILREQATDGDTPVAERKKALLELKTAAEENAKSDIDLAKRVTENKIKQLTLEKDGELKNREEINKLKIDQINVETQNANELRRINKQITAIDKEEQAKRKEQAQKAAQESRELRQREYEYNKNLLKLQQENELLSIKDAGEKELLQIKFRNEEQRAEATKNFNEGKLNRLQYDALILEYAETAHQQRLAATDRQNKELIKKEEDFAKELASIKTKTALAGITDQRQLERVQLQIGFEERLNDAIKRYKDDNDKLIEVRAALEEQNRAERQKLEARFKLEDDKKKFEQQEAQFQKTLEDENASYLRKLEAIKIEEALIQEAFDNRLLSEADFNKKKEALTEARIKLDEAESESKQKTISAIGNALGQLSELIGKQTVVGKGLAVAQATIATIQSAVSSYNSLANIPYVGPVLGGIAAAAAVASGVANVKKILAVQVPGQGGGGGSAPSPQTPTQAAPILPAQQGVRLDADSLNNIGNAAAGRTYVLDQDVANNRERNERLNRAARLGG